MDQQYLKEPKLNCGESGLAIRMFSPIAALYPAEITMVGANSLKKRPMWMIEEALNQLGVKCTSTGRISSSYNSGTNNRRTL